MLVRIRLRHNAAAEKAAAARNRHAALVAASLMTPVALMAWVLAGWRLLADLEIAGAFAISSGLFSHWQAWVVVGILVQFGAFLLHRFARS
jgi:hypothetical protein